MPEDNKRFTFGEITLLSWRKLECNSVKQHRGELTVRGSNNR